jgi:hypothetical protein
MPLVQPPVTPGGATTNIQYNSAGAFAGSANLTWDNATSTFSINGTETKVQLTAAPSTPSAGSVSWYAQQLVSGTNSLAMPGKFMLSSGDAGEIVPGRSGQVHVRYLEPIGWGATGITGVGMGFTGLGTATILNYANTTASTRIPRYYRVSAAGAGSQAGHYSIDTYQVVCNSNITNRVTATFGHRTNTTGYQYFVGMQGSLTPLGGNPSALANLVGAGYDSTDLSSGNWQFMHNDGAGTATRVDLGAGFPRTVDQFIEMILENNGATWNYFFRNIDSGATASGSVNTNTPALDTQLAFQLVNRNGAVAATCGTITASAQIINYIH